MTPNSAEFYHSLQQHQKHHHQPYNTQTPAHARPSRTTSTSTSITNLPLIMTTWADVTSKIQSIIQLTPFTQDGVIIDHKYTFPSDATWVRSIHMLQQHNMYQLLIEWIFDSLRTSLQQHVITPFISTLDTFATRHTSTSSSYPLSLRRWTCYHLTRSIHHVYHVFTSLHTSLTAALIPTSTSTSLTSSTIHTRLITLIHTLIFTCVPTSWHHVYDVYWEHHFRCYQQWRGDEMEQEEDDGDDDVDDMIEMMDIETTMITFGRTCQYLITLGWLHTVCQQSYSDMLYRHIDTRIITTCRQQYDEPRLHGIITWLQQTLMPFLLLLSQPHQKGDQSNAGSTVASPTSQSTSVTATINPSSTSTSTSLSPYHAWSSRLTYFTYERFATLRINEMFDIIIDYPESKCAIEDVKECMQHTEQMQQLITTLTASFSSRLLHPGAATSDIITSYISTIRAMRLLDPTGILLESVGEPIRTYLHARPDTVKCIVTSLIGNDDDENPNELQQELEANPDSNVHGAGDDTDAEDERVLHEEWNPDPIETSPTTVTISTSSTSTSTSRRDGDLLSLLISIYGTTSIFISEYRSLLATRLLSKSTYDTDTEVAHLELMKLRFGETAMQTCQVMIADMENSKRINTGIATRIQLEQNIKRNITTSSAVSIGQSSSGSHNQIIVQRHQQKSSDMDDMESDKENVNLTSQLTLASDVDAIILSAEFWPELESDPLTLPQPIHDMYKIYTQHYHALKSPRCITWLPSLGTVHLTLTMEDGRHLDLHVSPIHATILYHFQSQSIWRATSLAEIMGIDIDMLRSKITFWMRHAVIREIHGSNDETREYHLIEYLTAEDDENVAGAMEDASASTSSSRHAASYAAALESYVLGSLGHMTGQSLSKLHNTLLLLQVPDFHYIETEASLSTLITRLITQGLVIQNEQGLLQRVQAKD